jgi:hypothetical protein
MRISQIADCRLQIEKIFLSFMLSLFVLSGTSCTAAENPPAAPAEKKAEPAPQIAAKAADIPVTQETTHKNGDLVYLKIADAAASSFDESPDWAPKPDSMAPFDGDLQTRWSSAYKDGEWIYFDFGKPKSLSKLVIRWEEAYPASYEILTSDDAKEWKRLILLEGQTGGTNELNFQPVVTRYVKILCVKRVNQEWGISIWEVEPYGPKKENPEDTALAARPKTKREKTADEKRLDELRLVTNQIVPSPKPITKDEFQRGVNYTSWSKDELASDISDYSLIYLSRIGVGVIALMAVQYQSDAASPNIYADVKKTVSDESVGHAINIIHSLGMQVCLKPHVDLADDDARSNILPSEDWFKNYKAFILHYAEIAAKYNVELFCIGTELTNTVMPKWKDRWLDIISEIRKIYKGPLTYAANWDEYEVVSFWPEMDYIGIDAYFPLTNKDNPPKEKLVEAWTKHADTLETWLEKSGLNKPIIFTEIGYDTIEGSNRQPWRILPTLAEYKESQDEQSNCLESLLVVLSQRNWFKGFYWWNYFPRPDIGPLGYTLRGKKGEKILTEWYNRLK